MAIRTDVFDYAGPQDESRGSDITATGPVGLGGVNRTADTDEGDRSFLDKYIAYNNARAADADEEDRSFLDKYIAHYNGTGPALYDSSRTSAFYAPLRRQSPMPEDFLSLKGMARRKAEKYLSGLNTPEQMDSWRNTIAERQSDAAKLLNGTVKMTALAGTTFLDNTIGLAVGLGTGIYNTMDGDKDTSFGSGIWDNWFNRKMDGVNRWMDESFPNYYTDFEADESNTWKNVFSANFIGDKFIKNLGFTLGAAGSMLLTGGVAGAAGLSRGIAGAALKAGVNARRAVGVGKAVDMGVGALVASIGEGSIEALNAADQFSTDRLRMLEERHGRMMQAIEDDPLLTPEKKRQFMEQETSEYEALASREAADAARVGNTTLALNIPILTASNLIQFSKLLGNGYRSASRVTGAIKKAKDAAEGTYRSTRRLWKDVAGGVYRSSVTEGMEEVEQQLASDTATALQDRDMLGYISSLGRADSPVYAGMDREDAELLALWNSSLASPYANGQTVSMVKTVGRQLVETLTANSTWEQFLIGAMTGAMGMPTVSTDVNTRDARSNWGHIDAGRLHFGMTGGAVGQIAANREETGRVRRMVETMNRVASKPGIREFTVSLTRHAGTQALMDAALDEGDEKTYKDAELEQLVGDVMPFIYSGRKADLIDMVTSAAEDLDEGDADEIIRTTSRTVTGPDGKPRLVGPFIMADGNPMPAEEVLRRIRANAARIKETVKRIEDALDATDYATHGALRDEQLQRLAVMKLHEMDWADRTVSVAEELEDFFRRHEDLFQGKSGRSGEAGQGPMYRMKRSFRLFGRGGSEERIRSLEERPVHEVIADYARNIRDAGDGIRIAEKDAAGIEEYFGRVYEAVKASEVAAEEKEKVLSQIRDLIRMARSTAAFQGARDMFTADPKAMDIDAEELKKRTEGAVRERRAMHYARRLNSDGRYRDFRTFHDAVSRIPEEDRKRLLELMGNDPRAKQYDENTRHARRLRKALDDVRNRTVKTVDGKNELTVTPTVARLIEQEINFRETFTGPRQDSSIDYNGMEDYNGFDDVAKRTYTINDSGVKPTAGLMQNAEDIFIALARQAKEDAASDRKSVSDGKHRMEAKEKSVLKKEEDGAGESGKEPGSRKSVEENADEGQKERNASQNARDGITGRSLTEKEAEQVVSEMDANAGVAPEIELTIENWDNLFGEEGVVNTPIGEVKMGEHQFAKLMRKGRDSKLGMIKPTLENPDIVLEVSSQSDTSDTTDRPSSYLFIKAFQKEDGTRYYYFTSVTVSKDGKEVVVSNQEKSRNRILRLLSKGSVLWRAPKDTTASSVGKQGLDYVHSNLAESVAKGSGMTPQSTSSDGEDNKNDRQYNYLTNSTPEFSVAGLRRKAGSVQVAPGQTVGVDGKVKGTPWATWFILNGLGAYRYVNGGNVKVGDRISFMVDPSLSEGYDTGGYDLGRAVWIVHNRNGGGGQVIGLLHQGKAAANYQGLGELTQAILEAYDAAGGKGRFFFGQESEVTDITGSTMPVMLDKNGVWRPLDAGWVKKGSRLDLDETRSNYNIEIGGQSVGADGNAITAKLYLRARDAADWYASADKKTNPLLKEMRRNIALELHKCIDEDTNKTLENFKDEEAIKSFFNVIHGYFWLKLNDVYDTDRVHMNIFSNENGVTISFYRNEEESKPMKVEVFDNSTARSAEEIADDIIEILSSGSDGGFGLRLNVNFRRITDPDYLTLLAESGALTSRAVDNMMHDTRVSIRPVRVEGGRSLSDMDGGAAMTDTQKPVPEGTLFREYKIGNSTVSLTVTDGILYDRQGRAVQMGDRTRYDEIASVLTYLHRFGGSRTTPRVVDGKWMDDNGRILDLDTGHFLKGNDLKEARAAMDAVMFNINRNNIAQHNAIAKNLSRQRPNRTVTSDSGSVYASYDGITEIRREDGTHPVSLLVGTRGAVYFSVDDAISKSVIGLNDVLDKITKGKYSEIPALVALVESQFKGKTVAPDSGGTASSGEKIDGDYGNGVFLDEKGCEQEMAYRMLFFDSEGRKLYVVTREQEKIDNDKGPVFGFVDYGLAAGNGAMVWSESNDGFTSADDAFLLMKSLVARNGIDDTADMMYNRRPMTYSTGHIIELTDRETGPDVGGSNIFAATDITAEPQHETAESASRIVSETVETQAYGFYSKSGEGEGLAFRRSRGRTTESRGLSIKERNAEARRREEAWLDGHLPSLKKSGRVRFVKGLSRTAARGRNAWSQFSEAVAEVAKETGIDGFYEAGRIYIDDEARRGTVYHEAFHFIMRHILTRQEADSLIGEIKAGRKMSNTEAEERLAEMFRVYAQNREARRSFGQRVRDFFEELWVKLTNWNSRAMWRYFGDIYYGVYYDADIVYGPDSGFNRDGTVQPLSFDPHDSWNSIAESIRQQLEAAGITSATYTDLNSMEREAVLNCYYTMM